MAFNPGKFDEKIRIEKPSDLSQEDDGGPIDSWDLVAEPWAMVMEGTGREFLKAGQESSEKKVVFIIRWLDILETYRVKWDGRVYDIEGTKRIGRREGLELHAVING